MPIVDVDIDIEDFIDSLSRREVKQLLEYLKDNEYVDQYSKFILGNGNRTNLSDDMWFETCQKLQENRLQLSLEEIESIEKITSRFI